MHNIAVSTFKICSGTLVPLNNGSGVHCANDGGRKDSENLLFNGLFPFAGELGGVKDENADVPRRSTDVDDDGGGDKCSDDGGGDKLIGD